MSSQFTDLIHKTLLPSSSPTRAQPSIRIHPRPLRPIHRAQPLRKVRIVRRAHHRRNIDVGHEPRLRLHRARRQLGLEGRGHGLEHLIQDAADDLAHAHAQGVVALSGADGAQAADEDAQVLDDLGARQGEGVEVRVLGLLEQLHREHARGRDAEVDDRPREADLVLVQAVAVGRQDDDPVQHLLGRVEHVLLVLLRAVVREPLEQEAVQQELQAQVHAQDQHVAGRLEEHGVAGLEAEVGRETGVGLFRALLHVAGIESADVKSVQDS